MSHRHFLLIAGMHRSGTSALCAALERCGASFGSRLLNPMAGVNEDGFWEDADVVALNEQLLARLGGTWFAPPPALGQTDWSSENLDDLREAAAGILDRGFGAGSLQAVKDPRLCLTLPFWLAVLGGQGAPVTVCVMGRAPLEVARSLEKRDGFPVGYGLRLCALYRKQLSASAPDESLYVTYDELLQEPAAVMARLGKSVPLEQPAEDMEGTVRGDLRHHERPDGDPVLGEADSRRVDPADLDAVIARDYPADQLAPALARCMVQRGEQLTALGGEHSRTLDTLAQRDRDVEKLSALHREALATIQERDQQIAEFDRRLTETGEHLERALDRLREIQRIMSLPVIGHLLRALKWLYERR